MPVRFLRLQEPKMTVALNKIVDRRFPPSAAEMAGNCRLSAFGTRESREIRRFHDPFQSPVIELIALAFPAPSDFDLTATKICDMSPAHAQVRGAWESADFITAELWLSHIQAYQARRDGAAGPRHAA